MTLRIEAGDSAIGRCARQIARADGIAGGQIALDDLPEDGARALVELLQLGEAAGRGRGVERLVGGHLRVVWLLGAPSLSRFASLRQQMNALLLLRAGFVAR